LSRFWYPQLIHAALLEILMKKRGNCTDVELYDDLQEQFPDLSFLAVNKTLMDLELNGLIHVYSLTKNQRGVELIS
jgi:Fe2+ or Zn2+ uptake regulation protein